MATPMATPTATPIPGLSATERGWTLPTGELVASQAVYVQPTPDTQGIDVVEMTARLCNPDGSTVTVGGEPVITLPSRHSIAHAVSGASSTAMIAWVESLHPDEAALVPARRNRLTQLAQLFPVAPSS